MYYYKMSALEEVDVEQQLQDQDDSDSPVIKINTEVSEEKKEPKFKVGDIVSDTVNFNSKYGEVQPLYIVKDITEDGKYLIEEHNVPEGVEVSPPYEVNEDDLEGPINPKSPSEPFDTPEKSQELVENKEEAAEKLDEITSDETDSDDEEDSDTDDDDFKKVVSKLN